MSSQLYLRSEAAVLSEGTAVNTCVSFAKQQHEQVEARVATNNQTNKQRNKERNK